MAKVSIVIPAYNAMSYLESTLESVLQQTFTDFEVLIINDGSKDHIVEWASQIKDQRVKLISQENRGLSGARNRGVSHASGNYIAFLDADDLWERTKLEKQVNYLDTHPDIGLLGTKVVMIDEKNARLRDFDVPEKEQISLEELLSYNFLLCGSTPLVRRECFEKAGIFDTNFSSAADWDMWIRIAIHYKAASILEYLVFYRKHSRNMSRDVTTMVEEIGRIVNKARTLVPHNLHPTLNRRYAVSYLQAAWAMMEEGHYRKALSFSKRASTKDPKIVFSWSFIKLYFFIFSKRFFTIEDAPSYRKSL